MVVSSNAIWNLHGRLIERYMECIVIGRGAVVKGLEHISTYLLVNIEWRGSESRWFYQSGFEFAINSTINT